MSRGPFWTYIMASQTRGTLYVGMSGDLANRATEHRDGLMGGFTARYGVKRLVYFETFDTAEQAIAREKQLKRWNRAWKIALIEKANPHWTDLWLEVVGLRAAPDEALSHRLRHGSLGSDAFAGRREDDD